VALLLRHVGGAVGRIGGAFPGSLGTGLCIPCIEQTRTCCTELLLECDKHLELCGCPSASAFKWW